MANRELVVAVFANASQYHKEMLHDLPASTRVFSYSVSQMAEKNVTATVVQMEKLRELNVEYKRLATSATSSSEVVAAANMRMAAANRKLGIETMTMGKAMDTISRKAVLLGRTMTMHLTAPILLLGAVATKMFIDFQKNMMLIETQAGAKPAERIAQTQNVLNLAQSGSPVGPTDLSKGLYHLESLGLRGSAALKALKISSDAAGLGIANMEDVTTALGGAIVVNIKGTKDYNQAMGTVNATIGAGNMRLADYTQALSTGVLPTAKKAGMNLAEFGAALAVLTDRGMGAQMAATRLKMNISMMIDPTEAGARALGDLGIKSDQLAQMMQKPGGFGNALRLIKAGMDRFGTSIPGRTRALQDFMDAFGKGRSSSGLLTIVDSLTSKVSSYQGKLKLIQEQQGTWAKRVAAYHQTAAYQIDHAWASIQATFIKLGGTLAPSVVVIAKAVSGLVTGFQQLPGPVKGMIGVTAILFAALGPILLIGGKIGKSFLELQTIYKTLVLRMTAGSAKIVVDEAAVATAATAANTAIGTEAVAAAAVGEAAIVSETVAVDAALASTAVAAGGLRTALLALGSTPVLLALGAVAVAVYAILHPDKVLPRYPTNAPPDTAANHGFIAETAAQRLIKGKTPFATSAKGSGVARAAYNLGNGQLLEREQSGKWRLYYEGGGGGKTSYGFAPGFTPPAWMKQTGDPGKQGGPGGGSVGGGLSAGKAKMLAFARSAIGTPYVWGGNAPGGFDCSGLVQWAFANGLNVSIPHSTYSQAKMGVEVPSISTSKVGNVVFTGYGEKGNAGPGHEGLIVGFDKNGPIVESAPHKGAKVRTQSLASFVGKGQYTIRDLTATHEPGWNPADDLNPSTNYRGAADAAKKAAALKKAAAAAKKAALTFVKGIVDPIETGLKSIKADVSAAFTAGESPSAIASKLKEEVALYKTDIAKVKADMVGASVQKRAGLQVELDRLKNGLKGAQASVTKEVGLIGSAVAKALGTQYSTEYTKFSAQYDALSKLSGITIPGLTTDYLKEITTTLADEEKILKKEIATVTSKLKTAKGATKTSLAATLTKLTDNLNSVNADIEANMEAKIAALQTVYQTVLAKFDAAFGNVISEVTSQFEKQTQAYITNTIGPQYSQNGLLTASEQALKDLQDVMNNDSMVNQVNDARQSLISDLSSGADAVAIKHDQAAIKADEDAFKAAELQIKATEERTKADKDYAAAVESYTNDRTVQERKLTDSLAALQVRLDLGTGSLSELDTIMSTYGITLSDVNAQLYGIDFPAASAALTGSGGLVDSVFNLQAAFNALILWINTTTGSNVSITGGGGGGGGNDTSGMQDYRDALMLATKTGKAIPMASGGMGRVTKPTIFMAGEAGAEDFAFSGGGSSFGGGGEIHIHIGTVIGTNLDRAAREMAPIIRSEILQTQRRNATSGII